MKTSAGKKPAEVFHLTSRIDYFSRRNGQAIGQIVERVFTYLEIQFRFNC